MKIYKGYQGLHPKDPVITVGVFDGVHKGHRSLLERLVSKAEETGGESVVITFSEHPRLVLGKETENLPMLTTLEEKINLLEQLDVDNLLILNFDMDFSKTGACDFVREVLVKKLGARYLLFGYDHRIGREGEGDYYTIRDCTAVTGLKVEQAEGFFHNGSAISSSAVREALLAGNIGLANELLGYNYTLRGSVVEGRKIGRSFGFPTANITPDAEKLIPANGVYAVEAGLDGIIYKAMLSIGTNPTVNPDSSKRSIEVHLIDFNESIYGKNLKVKFHSRLRDEIRFSDVESLAGQMAADLKETLRRLS